MPDSPSFWDALEQAYGPFPQQQHQLTIDSVFAQDMARAVQTRRGEVVMVLQREDGRVLLHTKAFYPPDTWRLPTGGIKPGESPPDAARREILEETGLPAQLTGLLGVLHYDLFADEQRIPFTSFVFLANTPGGTPAVQDANEAITGYCWVRPEELGPVAARLRHLDSSWCTWGMFRALAHELVVSRLAGPGGPHPSPSPDPLQTK